MIGACAVTLQKLLKSYVVIVDPTRTDFLGNPLKVKVPYVEMWFGEAAGQAIINWTVPLAILFAIPIMLMVGYVMERGLIKHFYKRPHADQILVTFGSGDCACRKSLRRSMAPIPFRHRPQTPSAVRSISGCFWFC